MKKANYEVTDEEGELFDILSFDEVEKKEYEKANPSHYLELINTDIDDVNPDNWIDTTFWFEEE